MSVTSNLGSPFVESLGSLSLSTLGSCVMEEMQLTLPWFWCFADCMIAQSAFEQVSSVHDAMYSPISSGILDKVSASVFVFIGRYRMAKLKSANSPIQRRPVAFSFADDKTYVNGLLSVYTTKLGE